MANTLNLFRCERSGSQTVKRKRISNENLISLQSQSALTECEDYDGGKSCPWEPFATVCEDQTALIETKFASEAVEVRMMSSLKFNK